MINLLIKFALISHSLGQTPTETTDTDKVVYIDFEEVSVDGVLIGPRLTLITSRPSAKPDILIPDVRQLFIDKNPKRASETK
jgi:hypothetical protein